MSQVFVLSAEGVQGVGVATMFLGGTKAYRHSPTVIAGHIQSCGLSPRSVRKYVLTSLSPLALQSVVLHDSPRAAHGVGWSLFLERHVMPWI